MISLSECAQCRARRLQEESDVEFKERYGMIDLNRAPLQLGWKPYMGQAVTAVEPPSPTLEPAKKALDMSTAQNKIEAYVAGLGWGLPIGAVVLAFSGLMPKQQSDPVILTGLGLGLLGALIPFQDEWHKQVLFIEKLLGAASGFYLANSAIARLKAQPNYMAI